jgi:hypothetical protein
LGWLSGKIIFRKKLFNYITESYYQLKISRVNTNFYLSPDNYYKTLARLEKTIRSGKFASYTQQKKRQIWNRLCRYARQLGISVKSSIAAACFAAGLSLATPASAQQSFALQTGANNPLNSVAVGYYSEPTFVDIDGDGDQDAFIGEVGGIVHYFKNTGTPTAPIFIEQTGGANPLNGIDVGYGSAPVFVDIDGDGDQDFFVGAQDGTVRYYKNTGTTTTPVFTAQTGVNNPLNSVAVYSYSTVAFVDIDGDGDQDAFIGQDDGTVSYYKNTGTATAPVFTLQAGAANPLNSVGVGYYSAPAFVDIDGDGDKDAFIGGGDGTLVYYKNTGTPTVPVFTLQSGVNDPFSGVDIGALAVPGFVDIDGDGDQDVFIGETNGSIIYYKNTSPLLPLHLVSFSGAKHTGFNQLQWQTASEVNTKWFELERSSDGKNFTKIATINTIKSNGNNNYSINDNGAYNGKLFYRLKMVDTDGRFTYSQVIWINSASQGNIIIYPNPAAHVLNINISSANLIKTIASVYNADGRLMQKILITGNQQQINVQQFAKGSYVIKFADGSVQSFIKK